MARFPEGFVVLGDAVCSFNPIYGQGMSSAALQAHALGECLREERGAGDVRPGFPRRVFARVARVVDLPWQLSAGEDLRYPDARGERPLGIGLLNWYIAKVHQTVRHDPEVSLAFLRVMHLTGAPTLLLDPRMMLRVARGRLWARQAAPREPLRARLEAS
jgi:2-polyprenyl-6-methoxyphenol hydroxylase-like FAD-dependent oxidoreductase